MYISYGNVFHISDYSRLQQSDQSQSVGGILLDSEVCLDFLFHFLLLWFLSCLLASICLALFYFILITTRNHILFSSFFYVMGGGGGGAVLVCVYSFTDLMV